MPDTGSTGLELLHMLTVSQLSSSLCGMQLSSSLCGLLRDALQHLVKQFALHLKRPPS